MTLKKDQRFYFFKEKSVYLFLKEIKSNSLAHLGEVGCQPQALGDRGGPARPLARAFCNLCGGRSQTSTWLSCALNPLLWQGLLGVADV